MNTWQAVRVHSFLTVWLDTFIIFTLKEITTCFAVHCCPIQNHNIFFYLLTDMKIIAIKVMYSFELTQP